MFILFKNHTYVEIPKFMILNSGEIQIIDLDNLSVIIPGKPIVDACITEYEGGLFLVAEIKKEFPEDYFFGNSVLLEIQYIVIS